MEILCNNYENFLINYFFFFKKLHYSQIKIVIFLDLEFLFFNLEFLFFIKKNILMIKNLIYSLLLKKIN